jgi:hypothetical protein
VSEILPRRFRDSCIAFVFALLIVTAMLNQAASALEIFVFTALAMIVWESVLFLTERQR